MKKAAAAFGLIALVMVLSITASMLTLVVTPGVEYVSNDWGSWLQGYVYVSNDAWLVLPLAALLVPFLGGLALVSRALDI